MIIGTIRYCIKEKYKSESRKGTKTVTSGTIYGIRLRFIAQCVLGRHEDTVLVVGDLPSH